MKQTFLRCIAAFALTSLLFVNTVSAVETNSNPEYTDDESVAVTLEGTLNENQVDLSWDEYTGGDLKWYKVVHSTTVENPVYPDEGYVEVFTDPTITTYTHNGVKNGNNYYSICVITTDNLRGCTSVTIVAEGIVETNPEDKVDPDDPYTDDPAIEMTLEGLLNDLGKVELSWTEYDGGDLRWYKVVHSQTNSEPYYPNDDYIGVYTDPTVTTHTQPDISAGITYYRVCVITTDDRRGCSNTVTINKEGEETSTFPDVENHWSKPYVDDLAGKGIVEGKEGKYYPDKPIQRDEAFKIIMLGGGFEGIECDASLFDDMFDASWFCEIVTKAYIKGFVEGRDGNLDPGANITRAEAIKVLILVKGIDPPAPTEDPFPDVPKTEWFAKFVNKAMILGLIEGENGYFLPDRDISRGELAKIVSLAMN